jgi:tight adherence protein B
MTPLEIAGVAFFTLLFVFVAIGMVLRDLMASDSATGATVSVRRPLRVAEASASTGFIGKLDRGFDRLILESGTGTGSAQAVLLMVISGLVFGCVAMLWRGDTFSVALGILWGMLIPLTVFAFYRRRRMLAIQEQVPEVLALMSRAVHAGESIEQAVALAGKETEGALGKEFQWCARQLELGISVASAMRSLGKRVPVADVRMLGAVLSLHRTTGGHLASTLAHLAQVSRSRNSYRKQMRAATGAGRLSAQLIAAAGPMLFLYFFFFQSDHIEPLLTTSIGNMLLIGAAILEVIGVIWVMQMVQNQER